MTDDLLPRTLHVVLVLELFPTDDGNGVGELVARAVRQETYPRQGAVHAVQVLNVEVQEAALATMPEAAEAVERRVRSLYEEDSDIHTEPGAPPVSLN